MKKIFNNIFILFTATIFLGACEEEQMTVLNENAETTVSLSSSQVVLDILNTGQDALRATESLALFKNNSLIPPNPGSQ